MLQSEIYSTKIQENKEIQTKSIFEEYLVSYPRV